MTIKMSDIDGKNAWVYFGGGMIAGKIISTEVQGYTPFRHFHIVGNDNYPLTICACDINAIRQIEKQGDDFVQIWL